MNKPHLRVPAPLYVPLVLLVLLVMVCGAVIQHRSNIIDQIQRNQDRLDQAQASAISNRTMLARLRVAQPTLDRLREQRLFGPQDRLELANQLTRMRDDMYLSEVRWSVGPQRVRPLEGTSGVEVLHSDVSLSLRVMEDVQVLRFIEQLPRTLPGQLRLRRLSLTRAGQPLTPVTLDSIRSGELPWRIDAELEYDWVNLRRTEGEP
ncbi:MAG: hypothetical protein Alpg2KO_13420 [Alphaproteobacteria bacterium]